MKTNRWSLGLFLGMYAVILSVLPFFTRSSVVRDVAENIYWGQELQWGYHKHPPLFGWINWAFVSLFGGSPDFTYFLAGIQGIVTCYFVYKTAKLVDFNKETSLIIATFTVLALPFNLKALNYNANTAQIPFWAGCAYFYIKGIKFNKLVDWLIFGLFAGFGVLCKYFFGLFLASLFVISLINKNLRSLFFNYRVYLGFLVFLIVLSPHIYWLFKNNFPTFVYAASKSKPSGYGSLARFYRPFGFILNQILFVCPVICGFYYVFRDFEWRKYKLKNLTDLDKIILQVNLVPLALGVILSLILGVKLVNVWGIPMWSFFALGLFVIVKPSFDAINTKKLWFVLRIYLIVLILWLVSFLVPIKNTETYVNSAKIAEEIDAEFTKKYNQKLEYFAILDNIPSTISAYLPSKPHVLIEGDFKISPWIDVKDLTSSPLVLSWNTSERGKDIPVEFQHILAGRKYENKLITAQNNQIALIFADSYVN